jgi:hypothetical protein
VLRVCRLRSESASEFKALFARMYAMAMASQRERPRWRGAIT